MPNCREAILLRRGCANARLHYHKRPRLSHRAGLSAAVPDAYSEAWLSRRPSSYTPPPIAASTPRLTAQLPPSDSLSP